MRKPRKKKRPVVDEFGIDWGAQLRYIEEHPNDPAVVTAREIVEGIMQKHGLVPSPTLKKSPISVQPSCVKHPDRECPETCEFGIAGLCALDAGT